ncbi:MAG: F0F1 ATP synthase subunit B, partial [Chloroflexi bacterium]|nr:F0F1 ATP synthase subunit B [Chloroflexota bacterium]
MGELGINLPGLVVQLFNVALILIILRLLLYKPILGLLDRRSIRIKESLEAAERAQTESARSEEQVKKILSEARQEGQGLINQAAEMGERVREEARDKAKEEGEALISRARSEIGRERDEAVEKVRREFSSLAILAAEKVIDTELDEKRHRKLIDSVLEESLTST